MGNKMDSNFDWNKAVRIAASISALYLWGLSMYFSASGFGDLAAGFEWLGWSLAAVVTVLQLVWNKMGKDRNLTIWVFGIVAYAYSLITDAVGLMEAFKVVNLMSAGATGIIIVFLTGLIELVPEPLIIWGVNGVFDSGDVLGNLFGKKEPVEYQRQSYQKSKPQTRQGGYNPGKSNVGYQPQMGFKPVSQKQTSQFNNQRSSLDAIKNKIRKPEPTYHPVPKREVEEIDDDSLENFLRQ